MQQARLSIHGSISMMSEFGNSFESNDAPMIFKKGSETCIIVLHAKLVGGVLMYQHCAPASMTVVADKPLAWLILELNLIFLIII